MLNIMYKYDINNILHFIKIMDKYYFILLFIKGIIRYI